MKKLAYLLLLLNSLSLYASSVIAEDAELKTQQELSQENDSEPDCD